MAEPCPHCIAIVMTGGSLNDEVVAACLKASGDAAGAKAVLRGKR